MRKIGPESVTQPPLIKQFGRSAITLVYGPYTENIHSFDERVSIESLKQCTKTIALFVAFWCGVEPAEARDE